MGAPLNINKGTSGVMIKSEYMNMFLIQKTQTVHTKMSNAAYRGYFIFSGSIKNIKVLKMKNIMPIFIFHNSILSKEVCAENWLYMNLLKLITLTIRQQKLNKKQKILDKYFNLVPYTQPAI